jgi:hypothetical protein
MAVSLQTQTKTQMIKLLEQGLDKYQCRFTTLSGSTPTTIGWNDVAEKRKSAEIKNTIMSKANYFRT